MCSVCVGVPVWSGVLGGGGCGGDGRRGRLKCWVGGGGGLMGGGKGGGGEGGEE